MQILLLFFPERSDKFLRDEDTPAVEQKNGTLLPYSNNLNNSFNSFFQNSKTFIRHRPKVPIYSFANLQIQIHNSIILHIYIKLSILKKK